MKKRTKAFLISRDAEDRAFAEAAAQASGLELESAPSTAAARDRSLELLEGPGGSVLFVDVSTDESLQAFEKEIAPLVGEEPGKIPSRLIHLISADEPQRNSTLAGSPFFGHLLLRRYGNPVSAGRHYGRLLPALSFSSPERELLCPRHAVQILPITHSSDKSQFLEKLGEIVLARIGFRDWHSSPIVRAVDELLMNAMYDAPAESPLSQPIPRYAPRALTGQHAVQLEIRHDGEYVGFTVVDLFGSVNRKKLLGRLLRATFEGIAQPGDQEHGAGIGLATTFRAGGSLLYHIQPGARTEATVLFRKTSSYREFRTQFRFISIRAEPPR